MKDTFLRTIDVVGLFPIIRDDKVHAFLKEFLHSKLDKQVKADTLIEIAELLLKNKIFEFSVKTYKQICGTAFWHKVCCTICNTFYGSFRGKDFK